MKENMYECFSKLQDRVLYALEKSDLKQIKQILSSIKEPTLVSGVGGSSVVSLFLAKILSQKNNIICETVTARDLLYKNLNSYKNIIACSYSGDNLGVEVAFHNSLKKYLLSKNKKEDVINITYVEKESEDSFISLASTLIPMTISLAYYLDLDLSVIYEILNEKISFLFKDAEIYEIMSGYETSVASKFIESTLIEAGIGVPVVHDKYEYCHGRSNLSFYFHSNLIFLNTKNDLDQKYEKIISSYYQSVIKLDSKYDDRVINDYYFTYLCMLLCKEIAHQKGKDLSDVQYSPLVKKLYYFKGEM